MWNIYETVRPGVNVRTCTTISKVGPYLINQLRAQSRHWSQTLCIENSAVRREWNSCEEVLLVLEELGSRVDGGDRRREASRNTARNELTA